MRRWRQEALDTYPGPGAADQSEAGPSRKYRVFDDYARDRLHIRLASLELEVNNERDKLFDRSRAFLEACVVKRCLEDGELTELTAADTVLGALQHQIENDDLWYSLGMEMITRHSDQAVTNSDTIEFAVDLGVNGGAAQIARAGGAILSMPLDDGML